MGSSSTSNTGAMTPPPAASGASAP
jgi:hypothetical protein